MWMSIFAYTIRIGARLGLVKTEPKTPQERAYIKAHEGIHWLRLHLADCQVLQVQEQRVYFSNQQGAQDISCQHNLLELESLKRLEVGGLADHFFVDPRGKPHFDLGPGGFVRFEWAASSLKVTLQACDDTLGALGTYQAKIQFPAPRPSTLGCPNDNKKGRRFGASLFTPVD